MSPSMLPPTAESLARALDFEQMSIWTLRPGFCRSKTSALFSTKLGNECIWGFISLYNVPNFSLLNPSNQIITNNFIAVTCAPFGQRVNRRFDSSSPPTPPAPTSDSVEAWAREREHLSDRTSESCCCSLAASADARQAANA